MKTDRPTIIIIVPVYNEADGIGPLLRFLKEMQATESGCECVFVDAGSPDGTEARIRESGFRVVQSPEKGRAAQMNYGASVSKGELLYFLHADTIPPPDFPDLIRRASSAYESGCFRLRFDEPHPVMKFYGWFTRFDLLPFRYGDQSLFVRRSVFQQLGGFDEKLMVMEDNEFIRQLRRRGTFRVMDAEVTTSARKYRENGFIRLQLIFTTIFLLHYAGASQEMLVRFYRDNIRGANV